MGLYRPTMDLEITNLGETAGDIWATVQITRNGGRPFKRTVFVNREELEGGPGVILTGCKFDQSGLTLEEGIYVRVVVCNRLAHLVGEVPDFIHYGALLLDEEEQPSRPKKKEYVN